MNLAHFLRQAARRHPDSAAIVWGDRQWTWAELDRRVDAAAAVMAARGIGKGARVLVQARNSHQLIETMFACFRLGAIWVPTNFRQTPQEVAWLARSSGATLMICEAIFADHAAACAISATIMIGGDGPASYNALVADALVADDPGARPVETAVDYDDPCWFFYTSGTTGRPKAAVLTHGQMAFVVLNHLCDLMPGTTEEDVSLVVAPLTHGAGVHLLTQVARAAKTVLPSSDRFDAAEIWGLIEQRRVTNIFTVPTILKLMTEHPSVAEHDHGTLRHVIYAGAPMYREDQKHALATLGPVLVQYFGLGEVTGAITVLRPRDHHAHDGPGVKLGTCGRERTGMQISIQDDTGAILAPGETGEICVCGPAVFAGYHDNPQANAASFRQGWFRTGDLGHLDPDGDLFITGRATDMYISGGSNVYPREIEEKVLEHPAITEVAIVGMPDPVWGETGVAVCVLKTGHTLPADELLAWLKPRIASYKLPRRIVFWDSLPKSAYGKVTKAAVKTALCEHDRMLVHHSR
ncbi:acyl-CoA synthetase (AMP-forming)/AMP-acid ligase II [Novosphingobium capsulatum]|uniref:Acyl-CoA synthetase (AMP-forming)/AMP-acid ligase II n=1 Tax=Novosphingobium capsulatum TaxID=13688 RepID=A0ABU1MNQ9_9SPHN|nr:acyl-CoA synthetase [Novosphingobium capsulatum]MDR6511552.1 acyl-CoA synthetase (AMP-forming)/AMP-acid ligase II [Novosphingobium capsulatum]